MELSLIITTRCDWKCHNCVQQISQFPQGKDMDISHIDKLCDDLIKNNIIITKIGVSGGQPTLHKEFNTILEKVIQCPNILEIQVFSNKNIDQILKPYSNADKKVYGMYDGRKNKEESQFYPANTAPIDIGAYNNRNIKMCSAGIGLNRPQLYVDGKYYFCCQAGVIDRVFEIDLGVSSLMELTEDTINLQCEKYCSVCSMYLWPKRNKKLSTRYKAKRTTKQTYSKTWQEAKDKFDKLKDRKWIG